MKHISQLEKRDFPCTDTGHQHGSSQNHQAFSLSLFKLQRETLGVTGAGIFKNCILKTFLKKNTLKKLYCLLSSTSYVLFLLLINTTPSLTTSHMGRSLSKIPQKAWAKKKMQGPVKPVSIVPKRHPTFRGPIPGRAQKKH